MLQIEHRIAIRNLTEQFYPRAADETRTHDLVLTKDALYQLSYSSSCKQSACDQSAVSSYNSPQHVSSNFQLLMTQQPTTRIKAGEGNRTLVISLEGCGSTIELHPPKENSHCPNASSELSPSPPTLGHCRHTCLGHSAALVLLHSAYQWGVQDSNLRRHSHQIYSLTRLTASVTPPIAPIMAADRICHLSLPCLACPVRPAKTPWRPRPLPA